MRGDEMKYGKRLKGVKLDTFSKVWVDRFAWISCFWITILIIAPLFGAPAQETLGVAIITGVVGVLLLYFVKSYFGKRNEESIKLQKEMQGIIKAQAEEKLTDDEEPQNEEEFQNEEEE